MERVEVVSFLIAFTFPSSGESGSGELPHRLHLPQLWRESDTQLLRDEHRERIIEKYHTQAVFWTQDLQHSDHPTTEPLSFSFMGKETQLRNPSTIGIT